jgi:hypothetical protein
MKKFWFGILMAGILLVSCNGARTTMPGSNNAGGQKTAVTTGISEPIVAIETPTPIPTGALRPAITAEVSLHPIPSSTPKPTVIPFTNAASLSMNEQRALINLVFSSGKWEQLAMPEPIASRWEKFARGEAQLAPEETQTMASFLVQWGELNRLLEKSQLKNKAQFQFGTLITQNDQPVDRIALFLKDESSGLLQYLLIVRDARADSVGLLLAPNIEGLAQRISPDGARVEYFEPNGRTMLLADARKLDIDELKDRKLLGRLEDLYPDNNYLASTSYPRFFMPGEGIQASFYGLDESLSAMQILQLNDAFALYDRPDLAFLKSAFFGPEVSVIITNADLGRALGLTYAGTGVVEINRQDLFGNRYWITMVLAHEASHVVQGALPDPAITCSEIEKREIGNHKIPVDFYNWSAEELVQAVKELRIGAYHVSLWMMNRMGMKNLRPFQEIIQTGKVNGQPVVIDCEFSGPQ